MHYDQGCTSLTCDEITRQYFFSWLNSTFKKGSKRPLEETDIKKVLERDSTVFLATKLERYFLFSINH